MLQVNVEKVSSFNNKVMAFFAFNCLNPPPTKFSIFWKSMERQNTAVAITGLHGCRHSLPNYDDFRFANAEV